MLRNKYWLLIIPAALVALYFTPTNWMHLSYRTSILFRYVEQFRAGNGLVFNPDQRILLIPSPAYVLLLGLIGSVFPSLTLPGLVSLFYALALIVGSACVFHIARKLNIPDSIALFASILYAFSGPLIASADTALPFSEALCLLAFALAISDRWWLAGLITTLGALCNPGALVIVVPLLALANYRKRSWQYTLPVFGTLLVALALLISYYGPSVGESLLIVRSTPIDTGYLASYLAFGLLLIPALLLAPWGWYQHRNEPVVAVLGLWIALHLLIFVALLHADLSELTLITGPILVLAIIGRSDLPRVRPVWAYIIIGVVGLGTWVLTAFGVGETNLAPVYAVDSVQNLGSIGVPSLTSLAFTHYTPDTGVISFDGQLQPDLKRMIERDDTQSMLIRYAPNVILIPDQSNRVTAKELTEGPWAQLDYRPVKLPDFSNVPGWTTFQRYAPIGQFVDQPVSASFGPDIQLVGAALDQTTLKPGQMVRIRLDWQFSRAADKPVVIDLRLASGDFLLAHATDEYQPGIFLTGPWSTYHTLTVIPQAWSGPVDLEIGVLVNNSPIRHVAISRITIQ